MLVMLVWDWLCAAKRRVACMFAGHDWSVFRVGPCNRWLMHLHPHIACDADCMRCGLQWRDYEKHRAMCPNAREAA